MGEPPSRMGSIEWSFVKYSFPQTSLIYGLEIPYEISRSLQVGAGSETTPLSLASHRVDSRGCPSWDNGRAFWSPL